MHGAVTLGRLCVDGGNEALALCRRGRGKRRSGDGDPGRNGPGLVDRLALDGGRGVYSGHGRGGDPGVGLVRVLGKKVRRAVRGCILDRRRLDGNVGDGVDLLALHRL